MADTPVLALPSGSQLQFLLMTVPLFCVYLYFLWLAIDRPNFANPNDPRYAEDRIRLMEILYTYLATLVLFATLVFYLVWFVSKRRKLSKRYETEAITILGNVEYNESYYANRDDRHKVLNFITNTMTFVANGFTLRNNYGRVVYDLERVANHPACNYEERKGKQLTGVITKRVRVYYRYPREQVSILVIPEYPYSGQPKVDMEADWASFVKNAGLPSEGDANLNEEDRVVLPKRDRPLGVLAVATFWVIFLLLASLYVVFQIQVIDEYYEDEDGEVAWNVFWTVVGGVVPVVACGGNWLRWRMFQRWMLMSGSKKKNKKSKQSKSDVAQGGDDEFDHEEAGSYVQMT